MQTWALPQNIKKEKSMDTRPQVLITLTLEYQPYNPLAPLLILKIKYAPTVEHALSWYM